MERERESMRDDEILKENEKIMRKRDWGKYHGGKITRKIGGDWRRMRERNKETEIMTQRQKRESARKRIKELRR